VAGRNPHHSVAEIASDAGAPVVNTMLAPAAASTGIASGQPRISTASGAPDHCRGIGMAAPAGQAHSHAISVTEANSGVAKPPFGARAPSIRHGRSAKAAPSAVQSSMNSAKVVSVTASRGSMAHDTLWMAHTGALVRKHADSSPSGRQPACRRLPIRARASTLATGGRRRRCAAVPTRIAAVLLPRETRWRH
jgi:hypothetical protein